MAPDRYRRTGCEGNGRILTALITGDATITCAGDILMDNTGSGNVLGYGDHGNLDVQSAQNVTIHGEGRTSTDEDGNSYTIYAEPRLSAAVMWRSPARMAVQFGTRS